MKRRNPVPAGFLEQYNFSSGEFDHLMWIDRRSSPDECDYFSGTSHWSTAISVHYYDYRASFTYNQGLLYRYNRNWHACNRKVWVNSRIDGTITDKIDINAASLKRVGMAGYLEMRPRIDAMLDRIGELLNR